MRHVILVLAVLAVASLSTSAALAWSGHGGSYHNGSFNGSPGYRSYGYLGTSHAASVARVMSKHSRYGYNPHPRSLCKSPGYRGPSYHYGRQPSGCYGHEYEYYGRGFEYRYGY